MTTPTRAKNKIMKLHPIGKDEKRFTKERLRNTLAILFVVTLPVVIVSVFLKWDIVITAWWICMVIAAISSLVYKGYSFLKSRF